MYIVQQCMLDNQIFFTNYDPSFPSASGQDSTVNALTQHTIILTNVCQGKGK